MLITIKQSNGEVRKIGTLDNRIFRKSVKKTKHLYKKLDAWGIDAEIFTDVLQFQADTISVFDKEENKEYKTSIEMFKKKGQYLHFKPYRAQIFLSRRYWNLPVISINQTKLFDFIK